MANEIYYKRIDINGDPEMLPKDLKTVYIVRTRNCNSYDLPCINHEWWLKNVEWYLQPCTDKRDELIDKLKMFINYLLRYAGKSMRIDIFKKEIAELEKEIT